MKTLSIVIPCYNEEKRLKKTFKELNKGLPSCGLELSEIVFVNDGSKDNTLGVLQKNKKGLEKSLGVNVVVVDYKINRGKGYAVKRGMGVSSCDYSLLMDADISTPLSELVKFTPFIENGSEIIVGTRKNGESTVVVPQPIYRQLLGRVYTLCSQIMLNTWVSDFTCGFKLFSKNAKNAIFPVSKIDRWGYDSEILFIARKKGYDIDEKAVLWYNDKATKVNVFKDIFNSLFELIKIRYYSVRGYYQNACEYQQLAFFDNAI